MAQKNQTVGKVTAAAGIHTSNDIQNVELPTAGRFDIPEPSPDAINVISMNGSGPGDGPGTALRTRKLIADVVMSNEPAIVFFQEFKWKGIRGRAWKDTHLPGHYEYKGHRQASIMYDNRRLKLILQETNLQETLDEMKRNGKVEKHFKPLARCSIQLLEAKKPIKFKVLVVSWHGFHKKSIAIRKKQFQDLQIYLKNLSECENAPILLGGDFNIDMSLVVSSVLPEFSLYQYKPSDRRGKKPIIDYFIASRELDLADVRSIDLTDTKGAKDDPTKTNDEKDDPTKTKGAKEDPAKTKGVKDDPTKTKGAKEDPAKTKGVKDDPTKTKGAKEDPAKTKGVKDDPTKTKGAKDDPTKTKDVKEDLTKPNGAKDDLTKIKGAKDDLTKPKGAKDDKENDLYRLLDHDPISAKVSRGKAPEKVTIIYQRH
ncbi:uncharacterized protein LOC110447000 [Mizuhopecten yessoensis]|uniref:Uncharacterized protein C17orf97 n=1 Tax=Mizuhopecten yessoensis TaxID=6573 RepID=A0A210QW87_MIZYE|nr:uncharacterized protein LOC110447000 [Mizuhopecten yessoensis]OWF52995.1 Uncharacterized protein C17orf97 [Mizuhopecten yessoensis]